MSQLLNTGLDRETLATCVSLIEGGVNPEALAVRLAYAKRFNAVAELLNVGCYTRAETREKFASSSARRKWK